MQETKETIKNDKKGFTLVELLVTITILGILTIMALPTVSRMRSEGNTKQYEIYGRSILSGGKAYNNSYEEDLFGTVESGCVDVPYTDILSRKLVKEITISHADCNADDITKVRIRKANKRYSYELFMKCTKNDNPVYQTPNLSNALNACELNPTGDTTPPALTAEITYKNTIVNDATQYEVSANSDVKATVTLSDGGSGLAASQTVKYTWIVTPTGGSAQSAQAEQSKTVTLEEGIGVSSPIELTVPIAKMKTTAGTYKLEVTPNPVKDRAGNATPTTPPQSKTIKIKVTAPVTSTTPTPTSTYSPPPTTTSTPTCTTPTKPTVALTFESGGAAYTNNTWTNENVVVKALSESNCVSYYQYIVDDGSATKGQSKTFNSSGTHTIKYRACSSSGSCSAYSDSYTIKIDKDPPTCGDPSGGSTKWSKANYRTVAVACKKDTGGSGCAANKVSKKVTDECQTKNVTIKIKDNAGNETSCKNKYDIYLDRTPPTFVEKKQDITSNGWRHWRSVWKDNKSGLSTVNNGNYSKVYYCYGTQSNCSRRCTTSSHDSNTHKGTDGYYYRKANVDDNFVDGTTKGDRISFGTDNGCQSGKYLVRGDFHICDKANNCTDKHLKYDFR